MLLQLAKQIITEMHAIYSLPGTRPLMRSNKQIMEKRIKDRAPKTPKKAKATPKPNKPKPNPTQASEPGRRPLVQIQVAADQRKLHDQQSQQRVNDLKSSYHPGTARDQQVAQIQKQRAIKNAHLNYQAKVQSHHAQIAAKRPAKPGYTPDRRKPYEGLNVSRLAPATQRIHNQYEKRRK